MKRNIDSAYQSTTTQNTATTSQDDHLVFNMRLLDIWRFPVYGLDKERSGKFPFYDIVIPGKLTEYSGGGRNYDWYNPSHQNYNAISYPAIPKLGLFPTDLGKFSYDDGGGKVEVVNKPLNSPIVRAFDGNAQTFSLDYAQEAGASSEKSFDYSLSTSLDVTVGFRASANVRMFNGSTNYEGTVNLSSRSNWAQDVVAARTMRNSRGITLDQPDVPGISSKAYDYETLIYVTGNGCIKVAHGTDFLRSSGSAQWWKRKYGGRPDPALNLPWRMSYDSLQGMWTLAPANEYFRLRGLKLTEAEPDKATNEYAPLLGGVEQGTKVRLVLPVHNYSLDTPAQDVVVAFAYKALDPAGLKTVGPNTGSGNKFIEFARSKPVTIAPRGVIDVDVLWDTANLGGTDAGIPYVFNITVDPDNKIPNKLHGSDPASGAQTVGRWPWDGGFWVFHTGKPAVIEPVGGGQSAAAQVPHLALSLVAAESVQPSAAGAKHIQAKSDVAAVTIDMPVADRSLRQLIVSGLDADGQRIALASRTLYGLGPGQHRLDITLGAHKDLTGVTALQAWMSSGSLRNEPLGGIGAEEADAATSNATHGGTKEGSSKK